MNLKCKLKVRVLARLIKTIFKIKIKMTSKQKQPLTLNNSINLSKKLRM
jgi:hypothetical protein